MRSSNLLLLVFIILIFCVIQKPAYAQDKTREETERELEMLKSINRHKKSLFEEQRALEEMRRDMGERHLEIERVLEDVNLEGLDTVITKKIRKSFRGIGNSPFEDQYIFSYRPGMDPFVFSPGSSDEEKTSWNFSKSVRESSFSKDYSFDVEKSAKTISMYVMGNCKSGEIKIGIYLPGGKKYSDIIIDESGNLNWRKSFSISEGDKDDKTGEWKFKISASKATGFFRISLQIL